MFVRMFMRRLHISPKVCLREVVRTMPRTIGDFQQALITPPRHEGHQVRIAFIGDPNVGKSTIINKLLARDICAVSNKAHTTRGSSPVALTTDDVQMVLVDTPGAVNRLHARKHKLPDVMINAPKTALDEEIDVLAAVIDAADVYRREYLSFELLKLLHQHRISQPLACSILVLNKVDAMKCKRDLLTCIDSLCKGIVGDKPVRKADIPTTGEKIDLKAKIWAREERRLTSMNHEKNEQNTPNVDVDESLTLKRSEANPDPDTYKEEFEPRLESWPHFERVFIVSALKNDGIDDLKEFILSRARKGIWKYRKEFVTKRNPIEIAEDVVKSKLLDHLRNEIPYLLVPKVTGWSIDESDSLHIDITIQCKTERELHITLGKQGRKIKIICDSARQQLCNIFGCEIALKLNVVNTKAKK